MCCCCCFSLDGLPCCMHEGAPFCTKEYAERFAPSCCVCLEGVAEAGVSIESAVLRYIDGRLKSPKGTPPPPPPRRRACSFSCCRCCCFFRGADLPPVVRQVQALRRGAGDYGHGGPRAHPLWTRRTRRRRRRQRPTPSRALLQPALPSTLGTMRPLLRGSITMRT